MMQRELYFNGAQLFNTEQPENKTFIFSLAQTNIIIIFLAKQLTG